MRKKDIAAAILELEPDNEIAANPDKINSDALKREWNAAKRRQAAAERENATKVEVLYRFEEGDLMSWKLVLEGTDDPVSGLRFGNELPITSSVEYGDNSDETLIVVKHRQGLEIVAADLPTRDEFDKRRIYTTAGGTKVAYKRVDANSNRVVLWSYRISSEIALGPTVVLTATPRKAKPTASTPKRMTQKVLAAWLISENPKIEGSELVNAMRRAFPNAKIGDRHGPHYLSLSRNGKLPEAPEEDPRTW